MFLTQPTSPGSPNNTIQSIKQPGALSFCMALPRAWRSPRCSMHQGRYSLKEKQFSKHFCNFPPFVNFLLKIQWGWIMKTPPHSVTENDIFQKMGFNTTPPPLHGNVRKSGTYFNWRVPLVCSSLEYVPKGLDLSGTPCPTSWVQSLSTKVNIEKYTIKAIFVHGFT